MSQIIVPGENKSLPVFETFVLTSASRFWSQLSPEDQNIAKETENLRPLMTLCMAQETLRESLIDLRLARTFRDWQSLSDRLKRVKHAVFQSRDDDEFRREMLNPCRVRLILLGASTQEAERISEELVKSVTGLRTSGEWKPDATNYFDNKPNRDIRLWHYGQVEQREQAAMCWRADGQKLQSVRGNWSKQFVDDEMRAVQVVPSPDPFVSAKEFEVDRNALAIQKSCLLNLPEGFTDQAVEHATKHVQNLFSTSRQLILLVTNTSTSQYIVADDAACSLDVLSGSLSTRSPWLNRASI